MKSRRKELTSEEESDENNTYNTRKMKKPKKSSRNIDADSDKAGVARKRYGKWAQAGQDHDLSRSRSQEKDKRLGDSGRSATPSRRSKSSEKGTRHTDSKSITPSMRTRSPEKKDKRARDTRRSITPSRRSRSPEKGKRSRITERSITPSRRSRSPEKDRKHRVSKSIVFSRRSRSPTNVERHRDSRSITPAKRSRSPVKDKMYRDSSSYTPSKRSSSPEKVKKRRNSRSTTPAKRSRLGKDKRHRDSRRSYTPSERSRSPEKDKMSEVPQHNKTSDKSRTHRDKQKSKMPEKKSRRSHTPDQLNIVRTKKCDKNYTNDYFERGNSYERTSNDYERSSQHFNSRQFDHDERNNNYKNSYEKGLDRDLREKQRSNKDIDKEPEQVDSTEPLSRRLKIGNINMRTGGAYIPPARLRLMQEQIKDKGSEEYQKIAWEALKKSIIGMTNKVNSSNIGEIVPELLKENIIRGRGVLARAIIQAQAASPTFTRVYAALVAIINTKFPEIGELILKRLIIQYKRGFRRNNKDVCLTAARFLAHLLNQEVAHEVLILEVVTHLLENPTEDSVEIAIVTLKECGKKLTQLTASGMRAITQRVRDVLHEGKIDIRVRYMIEVFFAVQKDNFKDFETIPPELDLVEEEDKYTHFLNLDDEMDNQEMLNIFQFDPEYVENEEKYKSVVKEILGDDSEEEGSGDEGGSEEEEEEAQTEENQQIIDMTETNIVCLRRKIYLTIQSSLDFEECAHKLLKLELKPGQILEMCYMILDCCAQQRTYEKFFGLLAQRFCQLNKIYVEPFTEIFENSYKTIHRLETNKLRNVAKFFAHLLYTDAISWMVLSNIKLNEEDTTSSSRIFIKILFQELCEYMGLPKLNERVKDITLQEAFDGLFPRDHPHNTRFAINFFTSIGLGGLTDELREHLKNLPKAPLPIAPVAASPEHAPSGSSSSSSSTSSSSSSSSSSSDSDSDSDQSSEKTKRQQKRKK